MLRFPRPFLPLDPSDAAPAETWEAAATASPRSQEDEYSHTGEEDVLRDPRRENTVRNLEHTDSQARVSLLRKNMPRTRQSGWNRLSCINCTRANSRHPSLGYDLVCACPQRRALSLLTSYPHGQSPGLKSHQSLVGRQRTLLLSLKLYGASL